jgi:hypothetical protein
VCFSCLFLQIVAAPFILLNDKIKERKKRMKLENGTIEQIETLLKSAGAQVERAMHIAMEHDDATIMYGTQEIARDIEILQKAILRREDHISITEEFGLGCGCDCCEEDIPDCGREICNEGCPHVDCEMHPNYDPEYEEYLNWKHDREMLANSIREEVEKRAKSVSFEEEKDSDKDTNENNDVVNEIARLISIAIYSPKEDKSSKKEDKE